MLADDCASAHAISLTQSLAYASGYVDELRRMLASEKPDADRAAVLVQALRNMLCAASDDLDALDDTQAHIDAVAAMQRISDAELFCAIADTPHTKTGRCPHAF